MPAATVEAGEGAVVAVVGCVVEPAQATTSVAIETIVVRCMKDDVGPFHSMWSRASISTGDTTFR